MCYTTQTYWYRYRNLVSTSLKIVGIVSVSHRFEKAGIAHPYSTLTSLALTVENDGHEILNEYNKKLIYHSVGNCLLNITN